jgi:polysaccharide deacetylase 2 family uncharacterized protein YibQ
VARQTRNVNRINILIFVSLIIGLLIVLLVLIPRSERVESVEETSGVAKQPVIEEETAAVRPEVKGKLYFIIDDVGYNLVQLEPFLSLDIPLTFAILPFLPFSADAAEKIEEYGHEYLIHAPMEPMNGEDPGPGALYTEMSRQEIEESTKAMLQDLSGAEGINNHMGSRFTSDPQSMDTLLKTLKNAGKFYLDSYTSAESVAGELCRENGMNYFRRDIFIDNSQDPESMRSAIQQGIGVAETQGHAILIGHVWSEGLPEVLSEMYQKARNQGFQFDTVSSLYKEELTGESPRN